MTPQKHTFLKICYFASFAITLIGCLVLLALGIYGVKSSLTLSFEELQWGGTLIPIFLLGIPIGLAGTAHLDMYNKLTKLGLKPFASKKLLIILAVLVGITIGISCTISIFRLDILKS